MNRIAICSTTMNLGPTEQVEIFKKTGLFGADFFSSADAHMPDSHPKVITETSCYNLAPPSLREHFYKIMMACEKKKAKEFSRSFQYECCLLIEDSFLYDTPEVLVPEFLAEHTLYGIPDLIYKQKFAERWREKFDIRSDFFFSDTITFNVVCDAYRYLNLDKSFLAFSIKEFHYKFLKMNGIEFLNGVVL